jgi:hypothetical protein
MPNSVHFQSSRTEHVRCSNNIFPHQQSATGGERPQHGVWQDKRVCNSDRPASTQPSQPKQILRSGLVGKPAPQSQNRPIKKDPLQPLNLMVPSLVKAEIQRIAQQESIATGLTVSASNVAACNHPGSCSQSSPNLDQINCDWNDAPDRINCDSDHVR